MPQQQINRCNSGQQQKRGPKPQAITDPSIGGFGLSGTGMSVHKKTVQNQTKKNLPPIAPSMSTQRTTPKGQQLGHSMASLSTNGLSVSNAPRPMRAEPSNDMVLNFNDKDIDFAAKIKMKSQMMMQNRKKH